MYWEIVNIAFMNRVLIEQVPMEIFFIPFLTDSNIFLLCLCKTSDSKLFSEILKNEHCYTDWCYFVCGNPIKMHFDFFLTKILFK